MAGNDDYAILECRGLNLELAYNDGTQAIYEFINSRANDPSRYAYLLPNGDPDPVDVRNLRARQETLSRVRHCILLLSLESFQGENDTLYNGPDYERPGTKQHIFRVTHPEYREGSPPAVSKYLVNYHEFLRFPAMDLGAMDYWNPGDLLGLFFALLGPAPPGADAVRFFLPLTAVYGRWCEKIMRLGRGNKPPAKPAMLNCTWSIRGGDDDWQRLEYFLGSSLGGFYKRDGELWHREIIESRYVLVRLFTGETGPDKPDSTGAMLEASKLKQWFMSIQGLLNQLDLGNTNQNLKENITVMRIQHKIQMTRLRLERFPFSVKGGKKDGTDKDSTQTRILLLVDVCNEQSQVPLVRRLGLARDSLPFLIRAAGRVASKAITRFGNCAETYPFMNVLSDQLGRNSRGGSWGLALKPHSLRDDHYNDQVNGKIFWGLTPPCANCRFLLRQLGHTEHCIDNNFGENFVREQLRAKHLPNGAAMG